MLPALTAHLLLAFALSSLCRYRANLLEQVLSSEISLLMEVFEGESDSTIIPAFRNLLFGRPAPRATGPVLTSGTESAPAEIHLVALHVASLSAGWG